ncbi:protein dispatched homolog 1-like [Diadema antillarum]|uniref:protein dispatched homolog 1-like n=1 Tax=Diadema antillarum TaxID=105358 RepID=UPI003A8B06B9
MALSSSVSSSIPPPPPPSLTVLNSGASVSDGLGRRRRKFSMFATLAKSYWNYPVFICLLEFVIVMSLGAFVVVKHGFPKFDDASEGIESRGTEIHNRLIPLENLLRKDDVLTTSPRSANGVTLSVPSDSVASFTQTSSDSSTGRRPSASGDLVNVCGNPDGNGFRMVFQPSSQGSQLLTPESLISMCRHDDVIVLNTTHFQAACARDGQGSCCATWSVANYVALLANKSSCYDITQEDVDRVNQLLLRCAPFYSSGELRAGCSTSRNCVGIPLECTEWDAIYSIFFYLTPSEFDSDAVNDGSINLQMTLHVYPLSEGAEEVGSIFLDNIHSRMLDDGTTKVLGIGVDTRGIKLSTYSDILRTNFVYIGIGGAVVTAIIWLYMESIFVTVMVLLQMALSVILGLTLPTRGGLQLYKLSHPVETYDHVLKDEFDFERAKLSHLPIIVVWGVVPIDNGNHWNPSDRGYLVMDKSFNLLQPDSQEWLLAFCSSVRNQSFYRDSVYEDCFVESLKEFLEEPCANGSAETWRFPCCGKSHDDFPYPPDLFQECTEKLITLRCAPGFCSPAMPGPRFDANNSIVTLILQFGSSVLEQFEYEETKMFWDEASSWVSSQLASAPPGLQSGWFATISDSQPYFLDNTLSFANGAINSSGYSILIAAVVVLLTTRNLVIVALVVLSIGGAVATTVASLVFAGWELNVFEASMLALIVGLSVDFTLHYGVAYLRASGVGRSARSEHAISTLSSANTMAALSSFIAGALMLPATVLTFRQLGIALQVTMVSSWSFGTFFFISLCRVLGPQADCGQLGPLLMGLCCGCRQRGVDISNVT